ncbi:MAG: hypothetical protein HN617_01370 [Planctomycetaceae bacterium]|nr:hypothetical protein [Planctomycetaceae bacterium]
MNQFLLIKLTAVLTFSCIAQSVQAQAYCALRDPVRQIGELYPGFSYMSHVGVVTTEARKEVGTRLPFTLHFNELGSHTLYAVSNGDARVGYVHVRPEITRWGIMEITWSLDADLRIQDFAFQRCRNRRRAIMEGDGFKKQLQGKSLDELIELLNEDGTDISAGGLEVSTLDHEFAAAIVRCALKTIAVTTIVWRDEVKTAMVLPESRNLHQVAEVYTPAVRQALERMFIADNADIERKTVNVFRIIDGSKKKDS